MRLGGTARKRAAAAGSTAIVTGVAAATVGLFATPALADGPVSYNCTGTTDTSQTAIDVALTGNVTATVAGAPKVGDAVTLDGFQLTLSGTDPVLAGLVDHITGTFVSFAVTDSNATPESGTPDGLAIDATVDSTGALSFTTPTDPAPSLGGFTAQTAGTLTFSVGDFNADLALSLNGVPVDTATVSCTGGGPIASVMVADNPPPPPPGTGTGGVGKNPPTHNPSPTPTQTHTTAPMRHTTTTQNVTSARPTLASTGAPYTIPMTATGAALLLLGGGMLVVGRRRRDLAIEGVADDGTTDGEPDAQD